MMKKLPANELKDIITNLYTHRNLRQAPVQAPITQSTATASAIDEQPVQTPIQTPKKKPIIATKPSTSQQLITPVAQPSVSQPSSKKKKKKKKTGSGLDYDSDYDDSDEYGGSIKPSKNVYSLFNNTKSIMKARRRSIRNKI
jgi:hypothetical protein